MPSSFVKTVLVQVVLATPSLAPSHRYSSHIQIALSPSVSPLVYTLSNYLLFLSSDHLDIRSKPPYSIDKTSLPTSCDPVSMQPHLHSNIEEALYDYKDMPTDQQRKKMDQVLLMHTNGDPHAAEGLRLTFEALVSGRPLPARTRRVGNVPLPLMMMMMMMSVVSCRRKRRSKPSIISNRR